MGRTKRARLGLGIALAGAGIAALAPSAAATTLGFTGALAVQIAALDPVIYPGAGTAVLNGSAGSGPPLVSFDLAGGTFYLTAFVVPVTDPAAFPIAGVQVTAANGAGAFGATAGGFGGTMPLLGVSKVCLFGPCTGAVANLEVPLSNVGVGGTAFVTGAVNLTVVGAPWTSGTAAVGTETRMGAISYPGGVGPNVQLVTAIFISSNIGASSVIPAFGTLSLHFIPEPATLALLGGGMAALVGFGRRRLGG
jgi:hypothetical protein